MKIRKYKKGLDLKLSKNFHLSEVECKCNKCSETLVDLDHIERLQELRDKWGPIKITSGYRCPHHNRRVGGATHSQHVKGTATDIQVFSKSPNEAQESIQDSWDGGLGRYDSFTHIDSRGYPARWDFRRHGK